MKKHTCFKCGKNFVVDHELDTDKPTCNDCFAELRKITTAEEYFDFIT